MEFFPLLIGIGLVVASISIVRIWQLSRLPPEERTELIQAGRFWSSFSPEERIEREARRAEMKRFEAMDERDMVLAPMRELVGAFFDEHPRYIPVLHQIANRSIYRDEFGDENRTEWHKALRRFATEKMGARPWFSQRGPLRSSDAADFLEVLDEYLRETWDQASLPELSQAPSASATSHGTEFEHQCAEVFGSCGYETRRVGGGGDQGADIIATLGNSTTVVQCKCYSGPVGNAAVQQAAAAKGFYDADAALVVTDAAFTRSARQLAGKLGVSLVQFGSLGAYLKEHQPREHSG